MSSLETTELKLRTTPTGGVAGEHSPYYRRLLSAGYKGYLQGTLGGAGYYGLLGLSVGALVGIPAMIFAGPAALMLIPAVGGLGVLKGAETFGNIGSVAAINAESADLAEQRRYLLDRYYDLPEGPEGDKQAEIIKNELSNQTTPRKPEHMFHWKTVAICAAIGGGLALAFLSPIGLGLLAEGPLVHILGATVGHLAAEGGAVIATHAVASTAILTAIGTAIGALAGATIGIDRHYVRSWFDRSENILHDDSHAQQAMIARSQQIERIKEAAATDAETKLILDRRNSLRLNEAGVMPPYQERGLVPQSSAPEALVPQSSAPEAVAPQPTSIASLDTPDTKVHSAVLHDRMKDIQAAMQIPAV